MVKKNKNEPVTFELLTQFYADFLKPQFEKLNKKMDKGFDVLKKAIIKNSDDIQGLTVEMSYIKDEISGLKADISDIPTKKEFNLLKRKVDTLSVCCVIHFPYIPAKRARIFYINRNKGLWRTR